MRKVEHGSSRQHSKQLEKDNRCLIASDTASKTPTCPSTTGVVVLSRQHALNSMSTTRYVHLLGASAAPLFLVHGWVPGLFCSACFICIEAIQKVYTAAKAEQTC